MSHLTYFAILAGCALTIAVLELVLGIHVLRRWRRLIATVIPVALVFTGWDLYAVHRHVWSFKRHWITGWSIVARLPVEELVFFVVVPICAVATFEAVRHFRPGWTFGDDGS